MAKGRQVYLGSEKGLPAVLWRGAKFPLLRYVWFVTRGVLANSAGGSVLQFVTRTSPQAWAAKKKNAITIMINV